MMNDDDDYYTITIIAVTELCVSCVLITFNDDDEFRVDLLQKGPVIVSF